MLPVLRILSFIAIVIALARPQLTLKEEEITAEGIDIALVMDLSSSMLAQDFKPDRLEVSKRVASEFVDKRKYDRIGLRGLCRRGVHAMPINDGSPHFERIFSQSCAVEFLKMEQLLEWGWLLPLTD